MNRLHMLSTMLLCVLPALPACNVVNSEPPDVQVLRESRPVGDAKQLAVNLKYDVGQLEITKTTDDKLFSLDLEYDRNRYQPKFSFDSGDRASMRLEMDKDQGFSGGNNHENDLTLRLTDKIPLDLEVATGVSESRLEMTGLRIQRMRLRGGVGKTEISFDKPSGQALESFEAESGVGELIIHGLGNARVGRVDLKGGIGHAELDLSGDLGATQTDVSIKVGVGEIKISIPRDADVEIEAEGGFLSNISAPSFDRNGRTYTHRGEGGAKIHINVKSGIGGVEVELI